MDTDRERGDAPDRWSRLQNELAECQQERTRWRETYESLYEDYVKVEQERDALAEALRYPSNTSWGIKDGGEFLYAIGQRLMELDEKELARIVFLKADKEKVALAMNKE